MKKSNIVLVVLLAAVVLILAGVGAFLLMGNDTPADSTAAEQENLQPGDRGENQPPKNNTPLTGADLLQAVGKAKTENSDTVGWLKIPGTAIDNSVLQSYNNEYYLRKTEKKEYDVYGCYFADWECNFGKRDELSPNTVIYGHSDLKNDPEGLRFSQLFRFTDEEFARKTPYVYFTTGQENLVWQVFAVFYTDTKMDYIIIDQPEDDLQALIDEAREKSLYDYRVEATGKDKILCLSTCSVKYGGRPDERFVVMAKLLPADAELAEAADFTVNPSPRQPDFS